MQVHERLSDEQMKRDDSVYIRRSTQNHRTSGRYDLKYRTTADRRTADSHNAQLCYVGSI